MRSPALSTSFEVFQTVGYEYARRFTSVVIAVFGTEK